MQSDAKASREGDAAPKSSGEISGQADRESSDRELQLRVHNAVLTALSLSKTLESGDVAAARREIAAAAAKALSVQRVSIWMFNNDNTRLRCIEQHDGNNAEFDRGMELSAAEYPAYFRALAQDRSLAADDARVDPHTREFAKSYLEPLGITSMLDAPVRVAGRLVGIICHEHVGKPRHWTRDEQMFAASMADFVALTLLAGKRREAEQAVEGQRAFLRQIIDLNPNLIFAKDRAGRFTLVNRATADFYNTTVDELIGKTDADVVEYAEEVAAFREVDHEVMESATERFNGEESATDPAGRRRWFQTMKRPLVDASGHISQVLGVAVDITDRKLAQEHQSLMVRELDHRVKNNLSSVQALAEETAKSVATLEEFVPAFSGRIRSMAVAHEALARAHWQGVNLEELVRRLIEPFSNGYSQRFVLEGEAVKLPPSIAPSLCMVLHELITNALKHGSLSIPSGRVEVHWSARNGRLNIVWRESNGPSVKPPSRRGFGTELIEGATAHQLRGKASFRFDHPQGMICELDIPLPHDADWKLTAGQSEQGER